MNPIQQARQAYAAGHAPLRSARSVEIEILGEITARLRAAARDGSFAGLAAALHDNRRLWIRLAADVADRDNGLPERLRAQIFYLAEFTMVHSRRVLHDGADPGMLAEINTAVMRGLGGGPPAPVPS